jgi:maleate isomerase
VDKLQHDRLGYRLKLGVLIPSTNTCVQPEFDDMRPHGVTNHIARIMIRDIEQHGDSQQAQVIHELQHDFFPAIDRVMTCDPAMLVLGMSLPTFWGGRAAAEALRVRVEKYAGVPLVMGSEACIAALAQLRGVKRLGVITPYQPVGDRHVEVYFRQCGYEVAAIRSLAPTSLVRVAFSGDREFLGLLRAIAAHPVDAIVQVGTNLAMADIAEEAERWLGIPVLAINAATYWHALRRSGIEDKIYGFGALLREH